MEKVREILWDSAVAIAVLVSFTAVFWFLWVNLFVKSMLLYMINWGFDAPSMAYFGKALAVFGFGFYLLIPALFFYCQFEKRRASVRC